MLITATLPFHNVKRLDRIAASYDVDDKMTGRIIERDERSGVHVIWLLHAIMNGIWNFAADNRLKELEENFNNVNWHTM